jgi:hypothetical protein
LERHPAEIGARDNSVSILEKIADLLLARVYIFHLDVRFTNSVVIRNRLLLMVYVVVCSTRVTVAGLRRCHAVRDEYVSSRTMRDRYQQRHEEFKRRERGGSVSNGSGSEAYVWIKEKRPACFRAHAIEGMRGSGRLQGNNGVKQPW